MAAWKHHVNIKKYLNNDELPITDKATLIIRELRRVKPFQDENLPLGCELEELNDAAAENDTEWFDAVLDTIYDHADSERVWVGI